LKKINNYCALPFRGMQVWTDGSVKPCCVYQQHNHNGKIYSFGEYDTWWKSGVARNPWWEDPVQIEKMVHIVSQARYVNFSGGEPLLAPALISILEAIPETCFVEINTNCTRLTDQHIELFKRLGGRISISLDGIDKHHEYVRHESSWTTIEKNIYRLLELNNPQFEIAFSYVLQHTSVYSFPNFWNYFKNFSNHIRVSEVVPDTIKPNMMTINSVLPDDVMLFRKWHKDNPTPYDDVINTWLDNYHFDSVAHENFKEYVTTLDEIRGCNFRATFNSSW
jgi:sulfatase maturation enzyme AslB (radical SAM superfamily)